MLLLVLILASLFLVFGFVILFGAPYLPTRRAQAEAALDLLALKPGQTFYDLGCCDGRLLRAAAKRGLKAVGYEFNPILAGIAWLCTRRYRDLVVVHCGNFWHADLSKADGVFIFLLDRYMLRLDQKLTRLGKPVKLASYAFRIPGKKPVHQREAVFLYEYK